MTQTKPLTNVQKELLRLFSQEVPEEQLLEIKKLLGAYFAKQVDSQMDTLWSEKEWSESKIEEWKNSHFRTPYKGKP